MDEAHTIGPDSIAAWMREKLVQGHGRLKQSVVARQIKSEFGDAFVSRNKNGNLAIRPDILEAFEALTPTDVVWSRSRQIWRTRRDTDGPGRMVR